MQEGQEALKVRWLLGNPQIVCLASPSQVPPPLQLGCELFDMKTYVGVGGWVLKISGSLTSALYPQVTGPKSGRTFSAIGNR